ncbi:hypothetical protein Tco_0286486 [Tanacetum coccineum]
MSNRHQELTSPEQTATGKDFSNPLIVDSLLKTIWSSMHHVFTMKHWLVQSKRLLGQEARVSDKIRNARIQVVLFFPSELQLKSFLRLRGPMEKASDDVSTAGAKKEGVQRKRSSQDKENPLMIEEERGGPKKKSKKELEQERLSYAEAIRLEEQMNEEHRAQIARDEEIA